MMREEFNEFSRKVADFVFSRHPEWERNARAVSGCGESSYLAIEFPDPPGSDLSVPATYATFDGEVTIILDAWHGHFDPEESESWLEDSLSMFEDLLAERLCVASFWVGDAWCGSTIVKPGAPVDKRWFAGAARLKIRTWKGRHDRPSRSDEQLRPVAHLHCWCRRPCRTTGTVQIWKSGALPASSTTRSLLRDSVRTTGQTPPSCPRPRQPGSGGDSD
jgi:hypothetical protein